MYGTDVKSYAAGVAEVKKYFPRKVLPPAIPRSVRYCAQRAVLKPINYYDGGSRGAQAYDALARELVGNG